MKKYIDFIEKLLHSMLFYAIVVTFIFSFYQMKFHQYEIIDLILNYYWVYLIVWFFFFFLYILNQRNKSE